VENLILWFVEFIKIGYKIHSFIVRLLINYYLLMKGIFGEPTGQPVKQVWGSQDSWDKSPEYFRQQKKKSFRKYAA
jgi:hypothetical protein